MIQQYLKCRFVDDDNAQFSLLASRHPPFYFLLWGSRHTETDRDKLLFVCVFDVYITYMYHTLSVYETNDTQRNSQQTGTRDEQ